MQRHDIRQHLLSDAEFLRRVGFGTPDGAIYEAREDKFEEVVGLVEQVVAVTRGLSARRPVIVLDLACGRSYASFAIYQVLDRIVGRPVRVYGVDTDERLIERCRLAAEQAGADMQFLTGRCLGLELPERPDVAISLHACDTATDEALAAAVRLNARRILAVPCCHREVKRRMEGHELTSLTQFAICKERLAEMATDAMRALLLREQGYEVDIVEFVPTSVTPKNLMIRAWRRNLPDPRARVQYEALRSSIGAGPALERLLEGTGPAGSRGV